MPAEHPHGILFLCVANSARNQMAEGLGRMIFGDRVPGAADLVSLAIASAPDACR